MDMIDITIVNVALPTIGRDLDASGSELEWVVSAYMVAFAAVLITAGSFGDLLGRKWIFCGGIAAFGLASLAAGAAQDPGPLIAARVVPGAAAAAMVPQLLGTYRGIVVLAAVPGHAAGGAGGQFATAQQLGGALGVAVIGTVFFSQLEGHSFTDAFRHALPIAGGLFLSAAVVAPVLRAPR